MANQELLSIVDLNGSPSGAVADKDTIHQRGYWHRDVHVWITNGSHMLQQQRALDKVIMPGEWDISASGHVEYYESYLDAAVRETYEELGIEVEQQELVPIGKLAIEMRFPAWQHPHRTVGENYVLLRPHLRLSDLCLQAEEVVGARFYNINQVEADLTQPHTAKQHASQPLALWQLGIMGMRAVHRLSNS